MHIIFGHEQANQLAEKYTVLELDTFQIGNNGPVVTAFCTMENVPLTELTSLDAYKKLHHDLIDNYKLRNWQACLVGIQALKGRWGGELDSFYQDLGSRINQYVVAEPPSTWSPVIVKDSKVPTMDLP